MSATLTHRLTSQTTSKAFAVHLALSILIFTSLVAMMFLLWFPGELFWLDGGWQGLKLVAIIDLILGPALTLVLYKANKPGLLKDLAIIATLQIAALAYGFYITHHTRTAAVVYSDKIFTTISASSLSTSADKLALLELTPQDPDDIDPSIPPLVATPPIPAGGFAKYLEGVFNGYPERHARSDTYMPVDDAAEQLQNNALNDQQLEEKGFMEAVNAAVEAGNFDRQQLQIHPFKASYASGVVLYDAAELVIVDYIPIEPVEKLDEQTETAEVPAE